MRSAEGGRILLGQQLPLMTAGRLREGEILAQVLEICQEDPKGEALLLVIWLPDGAGISIYWSVFTDKQK